MLKIGSKVQLRKRCKHFSHGVGNVNVFGDEVGIIIRFSTYGEVVIDFPNNLGWVGNVREVKKARSKLRMPAPIKTSEVPGCCTATMVYRFGNSRHGVGSYERFSEESIILALDNLVEQKSHHGCIVATTTSDQDKINTVLSKYGFYRTPEMKKIQHPDVNLILWHYPISGYAKGAS